jgi:hypothetical protein
LKELAGAGDVVVAGAVAAVVAALRLLQDQLIRCS